MADTILGSFTFETVMMLPEGHILGARLRRNDAGEATKVELQVRSLGTVVQVDLDVPNAMFVLSIMKTIQLEIGYPFPDDPRMYTTKQ